MSAINARCGASQQSIAKGDHCRVLFISQSSSFEPIPLREGETALELPGIANTTVYLNCYWRPDSPFIRAVYDDYGMSRLVLETPLDRAQAAMLFANRYQSEVHTLAGKNPYHDLAFNFKEFVAQNAPQLNGILAPRTWLSPPLSPAGESLDTELQLCWSFLCDMVRRHRVFVRGYCNQIRPLSMFMVHERAYTGLIAHWEKLKDGEGNSLELRAYILRAIKEARQAEAEAECDIAEEPAEEVVLPTRKRNLRTMTFTSTLSDALSRCNPDGCSKDSLAHQKRMNFAYDLFDGIITDDEFIEKTLPFMADPAAFSSLEYFQVRLSPITYVGADFRNHVGSAYAKFVNATSKQVTQDRKQQG